LAHHLAILFNFLIETTKPFFLFFGKSFNIHTIPSLSKRNLITEGLLNPVSKESLFGGGTELGVGL
jgi:hypothetical protein